MKGSLPKVNIKVIEMDAVPDPPPGERVSRYALIYGEVSRLKPNAALEVVCSSDKHGSYIKTRLKELAAADHRVLGASRSVDGLTRYFWLEPKDVRPR